jgi:hypothetical protein
MKETSDGVHKTMNVLNCLPKSTQAKAKDIMHHSNGFCVPWETLKSGIFTASMILFRRMLRNFTTSIQKSDESACMGFKGTGYLAGPFF